MVVIRPFQAIRPKPELAKEVAALPYDVMNRQEAKEEAKGNPYSFLHIDKAEIDIDDAISQYDDVVYDKARENLYEMIEKGIFVQEAEAALYIYQLSFHGHSQTGIVGCSSIEEYENDVIKKHERTREDKLQDRIRHIDVCSAQTGPIFLTYRMEKEITVAMEKWQEQNQPIYDFVAADGVIHRIWKIDSEEAIAYFQEAFEEIPSLYIADGHHRTESAVQVGLKRRQEKGNKGEHEYFLSVLFPHDQLRILDYNRVVTDLCGLSVEAFIGKVKEVFLVEEENATYKPSEKHFFGMYLAGQWYRLTKAVKEEDIVEQLDVSVLQDSLLAPILHIGDPRTDERISFVGGIRGLKELERLVDEGSYAVAFSMYPPSMGELLQVADEGKMMPPKSTWFEPKLRSGLFVHQID